MAELLSVATADNHRRSRFPLRSGKNSVRKPAHYKSHMPTVTWPAIPSGVGAFTLAMVMQLEDSQWWEPEVIRSHQLSQLQTLLAHCYEQVPFYRERLSQYGWQPGERLDAANFSRLPLLSRQDIVTLGRELDARVCPAAHGKQHEIRTSGSTGQPIVIRRTALALRMLYAISIRYHRWHEHDFSARVATIRHFLKDPPQPPDGLRLPSWGEPMAPLFQTGDAWCLDIRSNTGEQLDWLRRAEPAYLVTSPSVAEALALASLRKNITLPGLRQVRTFGETLSDSVRESVRAAWGVGITDSYSANELGHLALQIPGTEQYFIPEEHVYIEILDSSGRPVSAGESGRVIVTSLLNYATPLIRYEIGDHAELGQASECGRGLRVIKRILGRSRDMLYLPSGERRFASLGIKLFNRDHGDRIREFQVVQRRPVSLDIYLVMAGKLSEGEVAALRSVVEKNTGYPFELALHYVESIPRTSSGKFEAFRCELPR
ncbi:MAG: hypothetical protein RLZZ385_2743 [Pseudomonadota bacterium]|jgi:phenylacetate-CoA ligase